MNSIYSGAAYIDDYREFDASGLVWSPEVRLCFSYDSLDRLVGVTKSATAQQGYNATYGYDEIGNLTHKTEKGVTWTYNYTVTNHAHAVGSLSNGYVYRYDADGNMTQRCLSGTTYDLGYDVEGRLTGVTGTVTATFTYDGDGNRVKSVIDGVTTLHVGDHYEVLNGVVRKYYFFNGKRVAVREGAALHWLVGDHLSSTSLAVDASGNVHSGERYWPWGRARNVNCSPPPAVRPPTAAESAATATRC